MAKEESNITLANIMPRILWVLIIIIGFFLANILNNLSELEAKVEALENDKAALKTKLRANETLTGIIIDAMRRSDDRQDIIRSDLEALRQEVGQLQGKSE